MWHSCLAFVLAVEQNLEVLLKIAVLAAVFCGLERIHGGPIVLSRTSTRMAALRQEQSFKESAPRRMIIK